MAIIQTQFMKCQFPEIFQKIQSLEKETLRRYLFDEVKGLGFKEASHFMRNIGYRDLAILDRHILRMLVQCKVIEKLPEHLDKKTYFAIEEKFKVYSQQIKIPMDVLDLYFWSLATGKVFK